MSVLFCVILMVFAHIVDDYYLQGWLAQGKQKTWWEKNAPSPLYKRDYIVALAMHSFSWAFMTMLPLAIFLGLPNIGAAFAFVLIGNALIHAIVDDLKANKGKINLLADQSVHIAQVLITAGLFLS